MTMFVRNAASLIGPYFAPKWSNAPRLLALTSSIALRALHLKYTNIFTGNVDAAIDALTSDKPKIVEFPELFHKAIFYGLLPDLSIQCGAGWLHSKLIVLTRNSLLPDQINKWLTVIQQAAPLVPLPYPEEILTHNCSTMIDETIDMIGKMGRVFNILLTITKIYRLSTTLYHPSLPFPLNRSRGVFSIILGFITVMVLCHVMIQRFLAQSVERANKSKEDAIQALVSTDADQPRIAALPEANKTRLVGLLSARITTALESASSTQNGFTMQEISSFALPSCFELFISRLGYQIAKAAPELELKTIFPPLLRTSIGLVWNTSYFVQNIMNSYTSFQLAMKKMGDLQAFLNQERSNIPMENGNSLTFTNVSLSLES